MYGIGVHAFVSALGGREEKHLNPVRIVCRAGTRSILVENMSDQSQSWSGVAGEFLEVDGGAETWETRLKIKRDSLQFCDQHFPAKGTSRSKQQQRTQRGMWYDQMYYFKR
jgi:hypothetical protein